VDSASRTEEVAGVANALGVTCIRCDQPGVARARNAGAAATSAPFIAFTDDDCVVSDDWTFAATRAFTDDRVGFVTGRVVPDPPTPRAVSVMVDEQARRFRAGSDPAAVGHSANLVWRREAFSAIGGFDEMMGAGARLRAAAEHDAFWRALRAGWDGRYDPFMVVRHRQWRTIASFLGTQFAYGVGAGALAAKAMRLDGEDGRELMRATLWRRGIRQAARDLMHGYESGAAGAVAYAVGGLWGAATGRRIPLDGDRFAR